MNQKFRIKLRSYDSILLEQSIERIVKVLSETKAQICGPIPLPTKKEVYTVLRSPHVHKKSREQFQYKEHRRLLEVFTNNSAAVDALMKLDLNSAVAVEIVS